MTYTPAVVLEYLQRTSMSTAQGAVRIGLLLLAGYVALRLLGPVFARLEDVLTRASQLRGAPKPAATTRITTFVGVLRTLTLVTMWSVVFVIVLAQLGLDIRPILAGAGLVGLALGFGAQNLVRDLIAGFFLVLEDQIRVGDMAVVNGTSGQVEAVTFRTISVRDVAGTVHIFPNGGITTLANMTKGWSAYVLDVALDHREDPDRAIAVMRAIAADLAAHPDYAAAVLEPLEVFGVDAVAEAGVVVKARIRTVPLEQWRVGREYRKRLKKAFDAEGIRIPTAQRAVYVAEDTRPLRVLLDHGSSAA
jgi:small-conductance mechanosensitive channel